MAEAVCEDPGQHGELPGVDPVLDAIYGPHPSSFRHNDGLLEPASRKFGPTVGRVLDAIFHGLPFGSETRGSRPIGIHDLKKAAPSYPLETELAPSAAVIGACSLKERPSAMLHELRSLSS